MKSWELDEIFSLVSKVFKENDICHFWEAKKESLLDQLIVQRIPSLHFPEEIIKEEREDFEFEQNWVKGPGKCMRERDGFGSNGNEGPKKMADNSMSNENLHFNLSGAYKKNVLENCLT